MAKPAMDLARMFDASPRPVYAIDEDRSIVYVNRALLVWTGVDAPQTLLGRRVDYHSGHATGETPGVAAGLCPPPDVFHGSRLVAHVSCLARSGRLTYRRARFLPLGSEDDVAQGVLVLVDLDDLDAAGLDRDLADEHVSGKLHTQLAAFRAAQAARLAQEPLVGEHPAICRARSLVEAAIAGQMPVVVYGPPGSGRSHVARAIHYGRHGSNDVLIPVDCAVASLAILRQALVSRGTTPGQVSLLLADVDQLPADLATWLSETLATTAEDVRLLSTARHPLLNTPDEGLPEVLAWQLSTLEIELPPLAERLDDLPLLAQTMIESLNAEGGKQVTGLTDDALDLLLLHRWPDNLDELRTTLAAAHEATGGARITAADLPARIHHARSAARHASAADEVISLEDFLAGIETELIQRALRRAGGNKTQAARLLGLTRPRFYRRLAQLGLEDDAEA